MLRILLVDDTRAVHAFVKSLLSQAKVQVDVVSVFNGAEAVAYLEKDKSFDLILLDWEMPVLTGPEAIKIFHEMSLSIPVLMMTTKNHPDDIQKMFEMGVAEYLMKPFTNDILFEKITIATQRELPYAA